MLIEHVADVNLQGPRYQTPLHYAVLHNSTECVRLLLEHGARTIAEMENMTALHYTVSTECEEAAQILLNANVKVDFAVKRKIWVQTWIENERIWEPKDDPHLTQIEKELDSGLTVLHYAVLVGSVKMTQFFLGKGANSIALSEYGETCLHLAIRHDLHGPD